MKKIAKSDVQELLSNLNAQLGKGTLVMGSDAHLDVDWISTSCYELDFATGGGIPKCRITELYGSESSGKTTLALKTCNEFLIEHDQGIVIYIDVEKTLEQDYLEALVNDLDRFIIGSPDTGEQVVDIVNTCAGQDVDILLVVDSIAATVPMVEVESAAEKQSMGLHARLINKLVRVANVRMKTNMLDLDGPTTTILMLNQEREKIGVMFGDPTTQPGGKGKNFFSSVRIRLFSSGSANNKITEDVKIGKLTRKKLLGRRLTFNVVKNKCGVEPFDIGEMHYYNVAHKGMPKYSFDNITALFRWGVLTEVIEFKNGEYVWTDGDGEEIRYKSEAAFKKALIGLDDGDRNLLYEDILDARKTKAVLFDE